jgi:hypothetical protein
MNEANKNEISRPGRGDSSLAWVDLVREQVASLRFGTVVITIHDSRIVQIEKSEKLRLDSPSTLLRQPEARE